LTEESKTIKNKMSGLIDELKTRKWI